MQVYRGMDIGTAKPSLSERSLIPHHLIDIKNPDEQFTAGEFVSLAEEAGFSAHSRGALPVVSGGTGFYLKNLVLGLPEAPPSDAAIRLSLKRELAVKGAAALMDELAAADPDSAARIHINDEYRLLRALEVFRLTARPLSSYAQSGASAWSADECPVSSESTISAQPDIERSFFSRGDFIFTLIGLRRRRDELYSRINGRTAAMFAAGLADEVKGLFEAGYTPLDPGLRAIGYREFFVEDFLDLPLSGNETGGEGNAFSWRLSKDLGGVEELIARNSRRYAKRQITFFSTLPGVKWIDCGDEDEAVHLIQTEIEALLFSLREKNP
jgi:tRNA dimethylallyltransferase